MLAKGRRLCYRLWCEADESAARSDEAIGPAADLRGRVRLPGGLPGLEGVAAEVPDRGQGGHPPGVRPQCRFTQRGAECVSESGVEWRSGGAQRQRDRALCRELSRQRGWILANIVLEEGGPSSVDCIAAVWRH